MALIWVGASGMNVALPSQPIDKGAADNEILKNSDATAKTEKDFFIALTLKVMYIK